MSGILEALEERLLQFMLEHETKKTWQDWLQSRHDELRQGAFYDPSNIEFRIFKTSPRRLSSNSIREDTLSWPCNTVE